MKKCKICHAKFEARSNGHTYCAKCAVKRHKEECSKYMKIWRKKHINHLKEYRRHWNKTHKEWRQNWRRTHPEHTRYRHLISRLTQALRVKGPVKDGWPDDGYRIEVKYGFDTLHTSQFRRFAWLKKYFRSSVKIRTSVDNIECAKGNYVDLTIELYLQMVSGKHVSKVTKLWNKLLKTIPKESGINGRLIRQ